MEEPDSDFRSHSRLGKKGCEEHLGGQEGVSQEGTFGSWKLRLLAYYSMKGLFLYRTAVVMLFLRVMGEGGETEESADTGFEGLCVLYGDIWTSL